MNYPSIRIEGANESAAIRTERPGLWSDSCIDIAQTDAQAMRDLVLAVEAVVRLPAYRQTVLANAPALARNPRQAHGVFFGYDFHLTPDGPRLIEINTNAGGALAALPLVLSALAQRSPNQAKASGDIPAATVASAIVDMFHREWELERDTQPLRRIAIVDEKPQEQFLYPEFVLCQKLLCANGIDTVIADPSQLAHKNGQLVFGDLPIDLIYNRLTDFYLDQPAHKLLRDAYIANEAVFTPHPQAHALFADKQNLVLLADAAQLRSWGVDEDTLAPLAKSLLHTQRVTAETADTLWAERRRLFFKPLAGYGGKAVYRGEKLTKRVWEEILKGNYVAQEWAPPPEHPVTVEGQTVAMRYDVRNYTYQGTVLLLAARLYQGQTTNFRTPGGGFAPVFFSA